jgi:hypothetical protein
VDQPTQDLIDFYYSLPNWAQREFKDLLHRVEQGNITDGGLAKAIQNLMDRVEQTRDRVGSNFLQ